MGEADALGEVRLKVLAEKRTRASEEPSITGAEAERRQGLGVPDLTLHILQLTRPERIEQAHTDLAVDGVMTLTQLERYYDLEAADLNGLLSIQEIVRPIHSRTTKAIDVTFLLASQRMSRLSAPALGHRAGTTELRHQLGAVANRETWQVEKRGRLSAQQPDAAWITPRGTVAVEYDSGAYTPTMIGFKIRNFKALEMVGVEWGTTSDLRCQRLAGRYQISTRLSEWWK